MDEVTRFLSESQTFEKIKRARGGIILPLHEDEAKALSLWAKQRSANLRFRRKFFEKVAKDLGADASFTDFENEEDEMRHQQNVMAAGAFIKFLDNVDGRSRDYSPELAAGFTEYIQWMGEQSEALFRAQQQLDLAQRGKSNG